MATISESAEITKSINCFRIGAPLWLNEERFKELLALFERYKGVTDQITFFTSDTHPPLPLDVIRTRAAMLATRMEACRAPGYQSGINILATLGHHNENLPNSLDTDYTRMTDIDGNVCAGSFCPNDEHMRTYIGRIYRMIADAEPDYIWIDDDVRFYGHMPIRCGCFCDKCLEVFETECGTEYTRETLRAAFNTGAMESRLAVRRAWLQHNRDSLARLFALIERTVHEVKPDMPIGFMTGERYFEGYDFDGLAKSLAGPRNSAVMWRPGGGAYTEESLDAFVQKAHQIGRQLAYLPESVATIQSEIENFPYQRLKKSARAVGLEAALYIGAGCTGVACNVLTMYDEPLAEYEPLVAKLRQRRPFLDVLAVHAGRTAPTGIYTGWNKDSFVTRGVAGGWFEGGSVDPTDHADELMVTGFPAAYRLENAPVTALSGDSVRALSKEELRKILKGGVYMDPAALVHLNEMGYGGETGFTVEKVVNVDCIEEYLDHPLNAPYADRRRDGRQSFWKVPCSCLAPQSGATPLAHAVDYGRKEISPCCMGIYENSFGGRVCVAGYYPWSHLQNLSKSSQLKSVIRWLSRDTIAGYVESYHRITLWLRPKASGGMAAILCNCYLDPAEDVSLLLKTPNNSAKFLTADVADVAVTGMCAGGGYTRFTLPPIAPWEVALLYVA